MSSISTADATALFSRNPGYFKSAYRASWMFSWICIAILFTTLNMALGKEELGKLTGIAKGCGAFSSNFHKAVASAAKGNIINSPLSTHIVLSYLFHGSDGLTAKEMLAGLQLSDTDKLHEEYKKFISLLNSLDKVELSMANGLFLAEGVDLHDAFQSKGKDFYNFSLQNVNFADKIAAVKSINDWVSKNTNNKINNIMSPDDINDYMKVVLVNAIYFKGQWQNQFSVTATHKRAFHVSTTSTKQVPTMHKVFKYFHGEIPSLNSRFLDIPYMEADLEMIIVLPNDIEGLSFVEENFDWSAVVGAQRVRRPTQLYLPKFKIEATIDLNNVLREIGLKSMFEDTADFSKMSTVPLKVDSVIQKAFLEVNEFGSEAAAATVVRMMMKRSLETMDEPDEFVVDRPFIVAIRHVPSNIPLFISSVRDIDSAAIPEKDEL